jgi:hypothetical protein
MKNHIAEELPARKHAPAAAGAAPTDKGDKKDDSGKSPEQRAKQAVYDIRYRARREDIPLRQAFSQYMQNSSMGGQEQTIVKAKLFGKEGGGMKAEDFNPIFKNAASDNVAKALFKVFVEGTEQEPISLTYVEELDSAEHRKYKVRVTDKNTKRSYVRMATREKINQLRANPNIESVEMTQYGEPYEGERKKGSQTAKVAAGKGLDPVGQEDGDVDNDGDKDKSDKYLMKRRGAIGNAIATRKEEFIHEAETEDSNIKKIDYKKGKVKNNVTVGPEQGGKGIMAHNELEGEMIVENGYSKFLKKVHSLQEKAVSQNQQQLAGMALAYLRGEMPDASEEVKKMAKMGEKKLRDFAKTKHKGLPEKVKEEMECGSDEKKKKGEKQVDPRSIPTTTNLIKNKLRAMGMKNPMVMVTTEGTVEEGAGLSVGISKIAGQLNANPRTSAEQGAKSFQKNVTDPIGNAVKGAVRAVVQPANMSPEAQKARTNKYRPEEVELEGEMIDERRKEDKVAETPRKPRDKAFELVAKSMGASRMGVQPRGQRKEPGKKPPEAGEYGSERRSPEQIVKNRRAARQQGRDNMSSRFD